MAILQLASLIFSIAVRCLATRYGQKKQ